MLTSAIAKAFNDYFEIVFADTPELREEVFRIRYQVYCQELQYEPASEHVDGMERDAYDARSQHCLLLHRSSGRYAGCIRLVMPDPGDRSEKLPFETICADALYPDLVEPIFAKRHLLGEYSRLAVPEEFRRRKEDKGHPLGNIDMPATNRFEQRQFAHIPLGLYLAGAAIGVRMGLDGVVAMMEPRLARHLRRFGMIYEQIGDVVDYHGPRAPFYCNRETLFKHLDSEMKKMMTDLIADVPPLLDTGTG